MLIEPGYNTTNKLFALVWSFVALPVGSCAQYEITCKRECGRPRKAWQQCINCELKSLSCQKTTPQTIMLGERH